jgi:hypothetical protein
MLGLALLLAPKPASYLLYYLGKTRNHHEKKAYGREVEPDNKSPKLIHSRAVVMGSLVFSQSKQGDTI